MKEKRSRRSFSSTRNKIVFSIYVIMFPALIAVGVFMHNRDTHAVISEDMQRYQSSVDMLNSSVGYFEQDLLDILTYVIVNSDVGAVLRAPETLGASDPLFWNSLSPMNFVTDMLNVKGNIRTFILYPENGLVPYYSSLDGSVMVKNIAELRELDIYRRALEAKGDTVWDRIPAGLSGLYEKNKFDKIVLAREIFDGSKHNALGFMALSVDVSQYEQMLQATLSLPYDGVIMLDGEYGEIARAGEIDDAVLNYITESGLTKTLVDSAGRVEAVEGHYVFAATRDTDGWIFLISPKEAWDAKVMAGLAMPIWLALALLLSVFPISLVASRIITKPLHKLHYSMNKFRKGDFTQRVEVTGHDEIADLGEAFNTMVTDMREMIDRNYVMVLREKESELNALQAQINPHFLYNALDSLYWQAAEAEQEELAENILALSRLFRLLLSSGRSEISVQQEIDLVSNYLHIQKMRFSDKLDYSITVDESMLDHPISKLIIQPFVENAIVHGLERTDSWGCVQVRGEMKDAQLQFIIEDNGVGMSMEKVEEILSTPTDERYAKARVGHYAIRNVKARMALRYGERASLDIQSSPGAGTRVCITIPAEPEGGGAQAERENENE